MESVKWRTTGSPFLVILSGSIWHLPKLVLISYLWDDDLVCNVHICHSQPVRIIGMNCHFESHLSLFMSAESSLNLEWLSLQIHSEWSTVRDWMRVCEWIHANPSPLLEKPLWTPNHGSVASAYGGKQDKCVSVSLIFGMVYFCGTEELKYKRECFIHCRQSNIWFFNGT